MKKNFKR